MTDLTGANLQGALLIGVVFTKTVFRGADLSRVQATPDEFSGITAADLAGVTIDPPTLERLGLRDSATARQSRGHNRVTAITM